MVDFFHKIHKIRNFEKTNFDEKVRKNVDLCQSQGLWLYFFCKIWINQKTIWKNLWNFWIKKWWFLWKMAKRNGVALFRSGLSGYAVKTAYPGYAKIFTNCISFLSILWFSEFYLIFWDVTSQMLIKKKPNQNFTIFSISIFVFLMLRFGRNFSILQPWSPWTLKMRVFGQPWFRRPFWDVDLKIINANLPPNGK